MSHTGLRIQSMFCEYFFTSYAKGTRGSTGHIAKRIPTNKLLSLFPEVLINQAEITNLWARLITRVVVIAIESIDLLPSSHSFGNSF